MTDRSRLSRRGLLAGTASTLALGVAHARSRRPPGARAVPLPPPVSPGDDAFWADIQGGVTLDRTPSNLNN